MWQCANGWMIESSPETWTLISLIMNYALSIMNYHLSPDFWLLTFDKRTKTKDKRKSRASSQNSELNLNFYSPSSNFQSRKLSGQIFKLIIINCFQNSQRSTWESRKHSKSRRSQQSGSKSRSTKEKQQKPPGQKASQKNHRRSCQWSKYWNCS